MNKLKKNNVVSFPSNISEIEREIEAILEFQKKLMC